MTTAQKPRTGVHGFQGSPITQWCDTCEDYALTSDDGRCMWCDSRPPRACARCHEPFSPKRAGQRYCSRACAASAGAGAPRGRRPATCRRMTEQEITAAHRYYMTHPISLLEVAFREAERGYHGYRTATDLSHALRRAFHTRGLAVRTQSEGALIRHGGVRAA